MRLSIRRVAPEPGGADHERAGPRLDLDKRARVDYLGVLWTRGTFVEVEPRPGALVIGAARFGSTRLIDNIRIGILNEGHAA